MGWNMSRHLNLLEAGFNWLILALAVLVAISIGLITLLIPLNLALINLQMGGIWWLYEAIEYALYVGVFIAAPWVLHQGSHVRVDVFLSMLPENTADIVDRFINLIGVTLCLVLFAYGMRATLSEWEDGTLPDKDLRIANWLMIAVFAGSFLLLAFEFLFRFLRAFRRDDEDGDVAVRSGF
jgi:TRAP-type transport system small permease protein